MKHPYVGLPDHQFWRKDPAIGDGARLDPVTATAFRISRKDRIVTAGSCFAQHVGRSLDEAGFCHYIAEPAHPLIPPPVARAHHYGMFSARYGNVYTARQLRQLVERALGRFTPRQETWLSPDGRHFVDPFRPQIQPGGFVSPEELHADRDHHLTCVRNALQTMHVFVFTLGLTEAWEDAQDGAIFPIAPGVEGGHYDAANVRFRNFDESESFHDLREALIQIRAINPGVRFILTVSPVPLNATYEPRHVLVSNTWSKAVLRVTAEKACREFSDCAYFPSYEIITSPHVRGRYFGEDCREIQPDGVAHVMGLFLRHFCEGTSTEPVTASAADSDAPHKAHDTSMQRIMDLLCDEQAIDNT